ncbi:MAG: hypothetical protein A3F72_08030 [Bacteroidetes bacterium RIFCSPLOWO2_12_FULL_35_15]|nr:MAG: hypothetical protein A3F72_08030 [Bacteroidetes bacterium RIFCSPLOWO2_12_FULL_35_15]
MASVFCHAQERLFVNTYQSVTLPKGEMDIELWNTHRSGRIYLFHQLDQQLVLDYGLFGKLQTSIGLNVRHTTKGAHRHILQEKSDTTLNEITRSTKFSISGECKLKFSDPTENAIGSALNGKIIYSPDELELEGIFIIDKKTEKNALALNLAGVYIKGLHHENGESEIGNEFKSEIDLAYMRILFHHFGLGLEMRNQNVFVKSEMEQSVLFGGLSVSYFGHKFFINLNVSPQLANLHVNDTNHESLDLNHFEKTETRLIVGFNF